MFADLGEPLTLVMTDVEGSTELWEWDQAIVMQVLTNMKQGAPCGADAQLALLNLLDG